MFLVLVLNPTGLLKARMDNSFLYKKSCHTSPDEVTPQQVTFFLSGHYVTFYLILNASLPYQLWLLISLKCQGCYHLNCNYDVEGVCLVLNILVFIIITKPS